MNSQAQKEAVEEVQAAEESVAATDPLVVHPEAQESPRHVPETPSGETTSS